MARLPYTGTVDVAAPVDQPNDQLRVDASPSSFGAPLAQGLEAAGQGALDQAKFYGQVAADRATNNYLDARAKILNGDPTKPVTDASGAPVLGPDGRPMPDTGFLGKSGADAMAASSDARAALDETIQEQRAALTTPAARAAFDTQTRRFRAQDEETIATHARTQQIEWAKNTNATAATLALSNIAQNPGDPFATAADQTLVRQAYVRNAQLEHGNSPDVARAAVLKADQDIALKRVDSLMVSDPVAAQKVFDGARGVLASRDDYGRLAMQVKERYFQAIETPSLDGFVSDVRADAARAVSASAGEATSQGSFVGKIGGHESGGNPAATNSLSSATGKDQFLDKTWSTIMAQPDFAADVAGKTPAQIEALRTNPAISDRATMVYARMNAAQLQAAGEPVNAANLGLAHGFGAAGAEAILKADPNTPMARVLPSVMSANPNLAGKTAGQVVAQYQQTFGSGQVDMSTGLISAERYPSTVDYIRGHLGQYETRLQADAETKFPNYPDYQARYVQTGMNRIEREIRQQEQSYTVDAHIVQQAMGGPTPPISEAELLAKGPDVARAWASLQVNNPMAALSFRGRFDANARGAASGYGSDIKDTLDRVLAPNGDPSRISNAAQLNAFVGPGEEAPLTNTGADRISDLLTLRQSPQGDAAATQIKSFYDQMHGNLTYSNPSNGLVDRRGEAIFSHFVATTLPTLVAAAKAGNLSAALDPKSPDYLGKVAGSMARPPAQYLKEMTDDQEAQAEITAMRTPRAAPAPVKTPPSLLDKAAEAAKGAFQQPSFERDLDKLPNDAARVESLQLAVRNGRVSRADADQIAVRRGLARPPVARQATAPAGNPNWAVAPTPTVHVYPGSAP